MDATALQDKAYAFREFRTVEEASNAMAFDGMVLDGSYLKVGSSFGVLQGLSASPWKRCCMQCARLLGLGSRIWCLSGTRCDLDEQAMTILSMSCCDLCVSCVARTCHYPGVLLAILQASWRLTNAIQQLVKAVR